MFLLCNFSLETEEIFTAHAPAKHAARQARTAPLQRLHCPPVRLLAAHVTPRAAGSEGVRGSEQVAQWLQGAQSAGLATRRRRQLLRERAQGPRQKISS